MYKPLILTHIHYKRVRVGVFRDIERRSGNEDQSSRLKRNQQMLDEEAKLNKLLKESSKSN